MMSGRESRTSGCVTPISRSLKMNNFRAMGLVEFWNLKIEKKSQAWLFMFLLQSTQWTQAVLDCTAECLPFAVLHRKTSVDFFRPNFESREDSCSADAKDKRQWRGETKTTTTNALRLIVICACSKPSVWVSLKLKIRHEVHMSPECGRLVMTNMSTCYHIMIV